MELKPKKGAHNLPKKGSSSARPWPDLPEQLIHSIGRQPTLLQNISTFGGVTKSWRAAPRKCSPTNKSPWLELSNGDEYHKKHQLPREFNILFYEGYTWWHKRRPPRSCAFPWEYFVGFSHGVLVVKGLKPLEYFIWDGRYTYSWLPPWDKDIPFRFVALSSQWSSRNCVLMVLTGISSPAFIFYSHGKWVRQDNTLVDPYGSNHCPMQFRNAIGFEGKFYALSSQGSLAVIDTQLTITTLGKSRAVPSVPCRHFREYLVESCGEILLVFLISKKKINTVDHVEVFRLHIPKLSWVKLESLGDDRTLFAGVNCCMSVSASKEGSKSNCVYFSQITVENWWVYDMESECVLPGLSNGNLMTTLRHRMNK